MGNIEQDEQEFRDQLGKTNINDVDLGKEVGQGDHVSLVMQAMMIAGECGMGACRSLTEFIEMINNEDPVLIQTMIFCIGQKYRRMYGDGDSKNSPEGKSVKQGKITKGIPPSGSRPTYKPEATVGDGGMANFLVHHGVPKAKIQEFKRKIASGEIKLPNVDFSQYTPEKLDTMTGAEINKAGQEMYAYWMAIPEEYRFVAKGKNHISRK